MADDPPLTPEEEEEEVLVRKMVGVVLPERPGAKPPGPLRHVVAAVGLALFVGCLMQLLASTSLTFSGWWWFPGPMRAAGRVAVVLDPGHGGGDSGAVAQGVVEKDLNLDVARRLATALGARGISVRMTREDDRFIPLAARVALANATPGAIFVSIHFNDSPSAARTASGIETYYSETREIGQASRWMWASLVGGAAGVSDDEHHRDCVRESQRLAEDIQGALVLGTAAADRGIKERALYVTRRVLAPAVLVEGGFVSHPEEARRLGDPAYRQRLADLITGGIVRYLSLPPARSGAAAPAMAAAAR